MVLVFSILFSIEIKRKIIHLYIFFIQFLFRRKNNIIKTIILYWSWALLQKNMKLPRWNPFQVKMKYFFKKFNNSKTNLLSGLLVDFIVIIFTVQQGTNRPWETWGENFERFFENDPLSARKWLVLDLGYREAEWNSKKHGSRSSKVPFSRSRTIKISNFHVKYT